jgi:hypothetical protein
MRILVACEESQAVTIELRNLGHEAYSCDIQDCSGGHPEWHIKGDVIEQLTKGWDMMIAFPPCTHLAVSGAAWFEEKRKDGRQQQGIDFFMQIVNAPINKIAIENPIGIMSSQWRKPDQIINPWEYGHSVAKATCLWLKGLSLLKPTNIVDKGGIWTAKSGKRMTQWYYDSSCLKPKEREKMRNKTFQGIADAMAQQWGSM